MSYELRNKGRTFVLSLLPQGRRQLNQVRQFAQTMNQAAALKTTITLAFTAMVDCNRRIFYLPVF